IRFIRFVLNEQLPISGKRGINFLKGSIGALKRFGKVELSRKARPIGKPHRERRRSQLLSIFDHFDVVVYGVFTHGLIGMRERAVLVAYGLIRLVLKRIRINRVEFEAEFVRQGLYL